MVTRRLKPLANAAWATNVLVVRTPEHRGTGRRIRLGRFPAQFLLARCRRRHECADGILGQLDGGHKRVSQMTRNGRSGVSHAYRSEDRFFQTLVHMLGTSAADVQVFPKAHNERNLAKYQGQIDIDEKLSCRSHSLYEGLGSRDCQARSAGG